MARSESEIGNLRVDSLHDANSGGGQAAIANYWPERAETQEMCGMVDWYVESP